MRLLNLRFPNYVPLLHDLLKNTTILLVIEVLQYVFVKDPLLDKIFLSMLAFTLVGNLVFYLFVDRYIVGAGPVLSGPQEVAQVNDKQE